jgi:phosphonate ABC transporter permease subunit PhnE
MMKEQEPTPAQRALRRLLIIVAVTLGVLVYAYGWEVTDISLEPTQDVTRQESVGRALRELFSPNIFTQSRQGETSATPFVVSCESPLPPATESDSFVIALEPACGERGDTFVINGVDFTPNADVVVRWVGETGQPRVLGSAITDSRGAFTLEAVVPSIRGMSAGDQFNIEAIASWAVGTPRISDTTNLVIEKMIETIFLALIATTLALPISVVLSFMAAHNLMKPIKMPVGNALVGLALLPVGWWLGSALLGAVGTAGVDLGRSVSGGVAASAVLIIASVAASRFGSRLEEESPLDRLRGLLMTVVGLVVGIFVLGAASGLAVWLGQSMMAMRDVPVLTYLGNFLHTIGRLVELTIVPIAGVAGAFMVGNLGMRLVSPVLRHLPPLVDHASGALLGGVGGGLVMLGAAVIGTQAALLTLLTPLVAGVLGAQIPVMLYDRLTGKLTPIRRTATDRALRLALRYAGFVAVAMLTYNYFNVGRSVIEGRLPVADLYLPAALLVGVVLGAIVAGMTGIRVSMPMGDIVYNATRTILNALRSIEPLIMGIVFVIWVGIGPFAGVLALTLHSIASLGKLYSEQIENIDEGPIEALQATGANRLQMIIYAVVPQIVPPYIAFTLYRWDINVRMSTIIGFVGGGGIGFLLQQQINLLRYRDAGVAVLAIAIVVSILDYASASIRERVM